MNTFKQFLGLLNENSPAEIKEVEKIFNDAYDKYRKVGKYGKSLPALDFTLYNFYPDRGRTCYKLRDEVSVPPMFVSLFKKLWIEASFTPGDGDTKYVARLSWSYEHPNGSNGYEIEWFFVMEDGSVKVR